MEQQNKNSFLIMLVFLISVLGVGFIVWNWVSLKEKQLKIKAIQGCAQVATGVTADKGLEFNGWIYKTCLEDAGYQTKIK